MGQFIKRNQSSADRGGRSRSRHYNSRGPPHDDKRGSAPGKQSVAGRPEVPSASGWPTSPAWVDNPADQWGVRTHT